ncbi:hypothetical protein CPB85DRAFT_1259613 [Mucidula mucida]|nr:hypothetical protein CPB85DRAFT_1259613 [Mucidula mucida]
MISLAQTLADTKRKQRHIKLVRDCSRLEFDGDLDLLVSEVLNFAVFGSDVFLVSATASKPTSTRKLATPPHFKLDEPFLPIRTSGRCGSALAFPSTRASKEGTEEILRDFGQTMLKGRRKSPKGTLKLAFPGPLTSQSRYRTHPRQFRGRRIGNIDREGRK